MKFEKITPKELKNTLSYKIACSIFQNDKDKDFVIEDVVKQVQNDSGESIEHITKLVQDKLNMLMDNMIVFQHGSYYRIKKQKI